MTLKIQHILEICVNNKSSDLHLSAGEHPMIRVDGDLMRLAGEPICTSESIFDLITEMMDDEKIKAFEKTNDYDFSYEIEDLARFRVNFLRQNRGYGAVLRMIPTKVKTLEDLNAPAVLAELCSKPRGLILVTGPTGSGKSTTLAAMINYINQNRHDHIITIEDPIEFVHTNINCLITQREVHRDTEDFASALRASLREDPDIILVGELRDLETIRMALTAAETGHLVFGTLHTTSAAKTVDRIVDVFPAQEKDMVRTMISESLQAVISQALVKKKDGGRIAAHEIMIGTPAIRNLIRENKVSQITSSIETGRALGMVTLDQMLKSHLAKNVISLEDAKSVANQPELLKTN